MHDLQQIEHPLAAEESEKTGPHASREIETKGINRPVIGPVFGPRTLLLIAIKYYFTSIFYTIL